MTNSTCGVNLWGCAISLRNSSDCLRLGPCDERVDSHDVRQIAEFLKLSGGGMSSETCEHTHRIAAIVEIDFMRPLEPGSSYSAPVSVGMCAECGHLQLHAALPKHLGIWLEKR